jgi:CII-binding regulator of phage lambda lysogenization HflD
MSKMIRTNSLLGPLMKKMILLTFLTIFSPLAMAQNGLLEQKEEIINEIHAVSCQELSGGLELLSRYVAPRLKEYEKGSKDFELSVFTIQTALKRASDCLK